MPLSWSNEKTFQFIEFYQSEPVIWDPKNELHKDRNKVNDAWQRIADALQIPVGELKKKKESLMTAFRNHHKRKQESIRSGMGVEDMYKPIWLFYDVLETFLKGIYECKSIIATEENSEFLPLREEASGSGEKREENTETPNDAGINQILKDKNVNNTTGKDKNIKIPVKRRRTMNPPELENAENEMTNAFNTLNQALLNKDKKIEDDCELYGRLVANKLRNYSENERQEIMYEIDGLLLRRCRNNSPQYVSSPSQIIISKRPSFQQSNYACPSPSSAYSINRPLSSNSSHWSQNKGQIPSPQTYLISSPTQSPSHTPFLQVQASGQSSYTQEEVYLSTNIPALRIPEESVQIISDHPYP